jgi:hypothetical protein
MCNSYGETTGFMFCTISITYDFLIQPPKMKENFFRSIYYITLYNEFLRI